MIRVPSEWRSAAVWVAYAVAWLVCVWFVAERAYHAWHEFDEPKHVGTGVDAFTDWWEGADRNEPLRWNTGHAQIDFGGQWVMAKLFVTDGRRLYHRARQRELVTAAFPEPGDADALMGWFMGTDPPAGDGIGGPLYPPVHGLLYAPLAALDPEPAYRAFQLLSIGLGMFAGLAVSRATGGRVWLPLAVLGVFAFPGCRSGLDLGQNHLLTLALLAGGWWAMSRRRWVLGGALWGLLAFKPVWAIAFLPVPLLMGQWRASLAMCLVAAGQIAVTLPVVGVSGWLNWLAVGREASDTYAVNVNWVSLSRDLAGLPRRLLVDFNAPEAARGSRRAALLGWSLWTTVAVGTVVVYRLRGDRRPSGLAAGFLLLGAYLACYRFMYYDASLAVLPVGLLVANRSVSRAWFPLALIASLYAYENWLMHFGLELTLSREAVGGRANLDRPGRRLLTVAGSYRYAWDTAILLALWAWVGWRLLSAPAEGVEGGPDVGGPHERLADQHG